MYGVQRNHSEADTLGSKRKPNLQTPIQNEYRSNFNAGSSVSRWLFQANLSGVYERRETNNDGNGKCEWVYDFRTDATAVFSMKLMTAEVTITEKGKGTYEVQGDKIVATIACHVQAVMPGFNNLPKQDKKSKLIFRIDGKDLILLSRADDGKEPKVMEEARYMKKL